ncbi:MAG TPA: aminotransferase class V-fold PLP-dependent enzyme, partial [Miltoncostaeaceae bacterium]|nr:aminotransferase class V-fold PLP-dependent enzyme [Miltoncostaeaceae bacterium]
SGLTGEPPPPAAAEALAALADRLDATYPFGDARYAGQMLQPPHPVAWAAYALTMLLNPNNHALDGGPATSHLEAEAVAALAAALGLPGALGHLTSSGTMANLEALWVARRLHPDAVVVTSADAHYTHARMCEVVGVRHEALPAVPEGRLDLDALARRLEAGGVGTVVATLGTTGLGALDDLPRIADLCAAHGARLHVDAAYGGLFALLADGGTPGVAAGPFRALGRADSVVVDPHKHGLQPYGCGCVLFADPGVAAHYGHDSPYTYFTGDGPHPGQVTLECSRAGASAAALWATLRALPLDRGGMGAHLAAARDAALRVTEALSARGSPVVTPPELDIVCPFAPASRASEISRRSAAAVARLAAEGIHVATLRLDAERLRALHPGVAADVPEAVVLRMCLMKEVHRDAAGALGAAVATALRASEGPLTAARRSS